MNEFTNRIRTLRGSHDTHARAHTEHTSSHNYRERHTRHTRTRRSYTYIQRQREDTRVHAVSINRRCIIIDARRERRSLSLSCTHRRTLCMYVCLRLQLLPKRRLKERLDEIWYGEGSGVESKRKETKEKEEATRK